MKTLKEFKDALAKNHGYAHWESMKSILFCDDQIDLLDFRADEVAKRYATEAVKEALEKASENLIWMEDTELQESILNTKIDLP